MPVWLTRRTARLPGISLSFRPVKCPVRSSRHSPAAPLPGSRPRGWGWVGGWGCRVESSAGFASLAPSCLSSSAGVGRLTSSLTRFCLTSPRLVRSRFRHLGSTAATVPAVPAAVWTAGARTGCVLVSVPGSHHVQWLHPGHRHLPAHAPHDGRRPQQNCDAGCEHDEERWARPFTRWAVETTTATVCGGALQLAPWKHLTPRTRRGRATCPPCHTTRAALCCAAPAGPTWRWSRCRRWCALSAGWLNGCLERNRCV